MHRRHHHLLLQVEPAPPGDGEIDQSFAASWMERPAQASSATGPGPLAPAVSEARPSGYAAGGRQSLPKGPFPMPPSMISCLPCSGRNDLPMPHAVPDLIEEDAIRLSEPAESVSHQGSIAASSGRLPQQQLLSISMRERSRSRDREDDLSSTELW